MIQRIQSVLLFLAFLFNGSLFFNALYDHAMADPMEWIGISFAIILTAATFFPLVCIFLYKNRESQYNKVSASLILQVLAFGFGLGIYISLGGFGVFLWDETIGLAFLFIALLLQLYARKKIKDDIELVKSMDRIR